MCTCAQCQPEGGTSTTKPVLGPLPYTSVTWPASYSTSVNAKNVLALSSIYAAIEEKGLEGVLNDYSTRSGLSALLYSMSNVSAVKDLEAQFYPVWVEMGKPFELSWNDIHCATCDTYVSKSHEFDHWDDLCSSCYSHSDSCSCCSECGYSECECCSGCGKAPGWCDCCEYCGNTEYNCECRICSECGYKGHSSEECCSGDSGHKFGSIKKAPWTERSESTVPLALDKVPTLADCDNEDIDPIQAAADFYLLDCIKNNVRFASIQAPEGVSFDLARMIQSDDMMSALLISSRRHYNALVEKLDRSFLAYGIAAVGGELRYHRAVSPILPNSRSSAWSSFVNVVAENGADVLFDAVDLFEDFKSNSYGGHNWAMIAQVVAQRASGRMPAWLFVDRIITLQHNGGCVLNKVSWANRNGLGWSLNYMQQFLNAHSGCCSSCGGKWGENGCCVDAHEMTDYALLLAAASPAVRDMFQMSESGLKRIARRIGGTVATLEPSPQMRQKLRRCRNCGDSVGSSGYCYNCGKYL